MESISANDFRALDVLLREFDTPLTVRKIALKAKTSPPSVLKGFKSLEKKGILKSRWFGNALFYTFNFSNPSATYLACILLLDKPYEENMKILRKTDAKAILSIKDNAMIIGSNIIGSNSENDKNSQIRKIRISTEEFIERLHHKDKEVLEFIRNGSVIKGERFLVDAISKEAIRI